jgi:hypothetical protein
VSKGQGQKPVTVRVRCSPKTKYKVLFKPDGAGLDGTCTGNGHSAVTLPPGEGVKYLELQLAASSKHWLLGVPDDPPE